MITSLQQSINELLAEAASDNAITKVASEEAAPTVPATGEGEALRKLAAAMRSFSEEPSYEDLYGLLGELNA